MSSLAKVVFEDGHVMHCEYNGNGDYVVPNLYPNVRDLARNLDKHPRALECSCGSMEPVTLISDYGKGFEWKTKACKECCVISKAYIDEHWKADSFQRPFYE